MTRSPVSLAARYRPSGKAAQQLGLRFDTSQTAAATEAVAARDWENAGPCWPPPYQSGRGRTEQARRHRRPGVAKSWATVAGIAVDKVGVLHRIENGERVQVEQKQATVSDLDIEIAALTNLLLDGARERGIDVEADGVPMLTAIGQMTSNAGDETNVEMGTRWGCP